MSPSEISVAQQSRWLRKARKVMGFSVSQLAEYLGVTPRTINAWENESSMSLPARDKFIGYVILMSSGDGLPSPEVLINALQERDLGSDALLNSTRDRTTSQRFLELTPENRAAVALMIRSLLTAQHSTAQHSTAIRLLAAGTMRGINSRLIQTPDSLIGSSDPSCDR